MPTASSPTLSTRTRSAARYLWREWVKPMLFAAAIVLPFKSAIADFNWVPTGSMKPTIMEGDLVTVNKLAYDFKIPFTLTRLAAWDEPARGEIVVFFAPDTGIRLVKRIVAGPGDTIEMRSEVLYLNGQRLSYTFVPEHDFASEVYEDPQPIVAKEQYPSRTHWVMTLPSRGALRSFGPITVPPGQYFMMGDSRDNSHDSRFFGLVDRHQIVGRASRVLLSFDKNHHYVPRLGRTLSPLDE
jgi:signal peptidase I